VQQQVELLHRQDERIRRQDDCFRQLVGVLEGVCTLFSHTKKSKFSFFLN
jgi:hypothetical protein